MKKIIIFISFLFFGYILFFFFRKREYKGIWFLYDNTCVEGGDRLEIHEALNKGDTIDGSGGRYIITCDWYNENLILEKVDHSCRKYYMKKFRK